jgi:hypothetical protein
MTQYATESTLFQRTVLIMAPVLSTISTFFWNNGEYGTTGGTLLIMALFFWIPALDALFSLVKRTMPRYAQWGYFMALLGCISGMNFGSLGYYSEVFNISHDAYLEALTKYPISSGILLFWAGPLFPLSLFVLSVVLWRKRAAATWICICLGLAAIAFPISRIPRISLVAHIADLLFLFPMISLAIRYPAPQDRAASAV